MRRPLFHHHKHTGKLLHHRHTSYPVLFGLVIVVGILIGLTGRIASASDLIVTATVPAPIPVGAPVFTTPTEGSTTNASSVQFAGTCPVINPAIIVALYEGSTLLGSGVCHTDGTFQVTASLSSGAHTIIATIVTITGDSGESSTPFHVTYTVPTPATPTTPTEPSMPSLVTNTPTDEAIAPLDMISEKPFITITASRHAEWRGRFAGGVTPYIVTILWGDGGRETRHITSNDEQVFSHVYQNDPVYTASLTITDESGLSLTRNYAAVRIGGTATTATNNTASPVATILDNPIHDPIVTSWVVYTSMLVPMVMMWRYEHIHYPYKVIGRPLRYAWQKAARPRVKIKH